MSGFPIGIAATILMWLGVQYFWLLAFGIIVFQTAHAISPIGLAWSHAGFRRIMLARPIKFMVVPVAILSTWTIAGYIGGFYWPEPVIDPLTMKIFFGTYWQPLCLMGAFYGVWNIYHFGKQNFGVMSIYRHKMGVYGLAQRRFDLIFCCATAWATMAIAYVHMAANYLRIDALKFHNVVAAYITVAGAFGAIMLWREWQTSRLCFGRVTLILTNAASMGSALFWGVGSFGIISMNHWLAAIGLAGRASRRPIVFPIAMIVMGMALFCALFVRGWAMPTKVAAAAIAFRWALGIVHFLYDRWVWKFGDPQVRETIICALVS